MPNSSPPWWVPYIFLAGLVIAAFVFAILGRMTPAEFLAFAAALGFRAPQTMESSSRTAQQVDVQGEDVTVTESK